MNDHLLAQGKFLSTRIEILKFKKSLLPTCSKENKVNFIVYNTQQYTTNYHLLAKDEFLSTRQQNLKFEQAY